MFFQYMLSQWRRTYELNINFNESAQLHFITGIYTENSVQFEISLWSKWLKWSSNRESLQGTEVTFAAEVKFQTGLSSLRVSCKRALTLIMNGFFRRELLTAFRELQEDFDANSFTKKFKPETWTITWRRSLSYRNQPTDLQSKSMY